MARTRCQQQAPRGALRIPALAWVLFVCSLLPLGAQQVEPCEGRDGYMCRGFFEDCIGGSAVEGCWCERKTLGAHKSSRRYTCCNKSLSTGSSDDGVYCGHYDQDYLATCEKIGAVMLVASVVTVIVTTFALQHGRCNGRPQLSPEARALVQILHSGGNDVQDAKLIEDGTQLHHALDAALWCVNKEQLEEFLLIVRTAVDEGQVQPTVLDQFDPEDSKIGPCVYTVVHQLIKPITAARGNVSWALMKNPQGLNCDLFVTHGWAEGIYSFCRRVLSAWPKGCEGAYICFLANPQNMDIASLVAAPGDSPFAKALDAAETMLVVSNHVSSIYTRVWCAYEAFRAYQASTRIFLAPEPLRMPFVHALQIVGYFAAGCSCGLFLLRPPAVRYVPQVSMMSICFFIVLGSCFMKRPDSYVRAASIRLMSFNLGILGGRSLLYLRFLSLQPFCYIILCVASELDRLQSSSALQVKAEVQKGFTGRLEAAEASVQADYEAIMAEIWEAGNHREVEEFLQGLLNQGISTPELRVTAQLCGTLGDASQRRPLLVSFAIAFPLLVTNVCLDSSALWWVKASILFGLAVCQSILWLCLVARQPRDCQAFSVAANKLWLWTMVPCCILPGCVMLAGFLAHDTFSIISFSYTIPMGFVILALTAAGPLRAARLPCLGPLLVRALFAEGFCGRTPQAAFYRTSLVKDDLPAKEPSLSGAAVLGSCILAVKEEKEGETSGRDS